MLVIVRFHAYFGQTFYDFITRAKEGSFFNSIKVLFNHVSQPEAELHMFTKIKDTIMVT